MAGSIHRIVLLPLDALSERIAVESWKAHAHWCMVDRSTLGILAAGVRTRILTFLSNASQIVGALGVADAFRATAWRGADVSLQARARGRIPDSSAFRIWTTWRWLARIDGLVLYGYLDNRLAANERIACVSHWATTYGIVIDNCALGTYSTCSRAWVTALLVYASLILGTVRIEHTFGPAVGRTSDVADNARAYALTIYFTTLAIGTTWGGMAGIGMYGILSWDGSAVDEGVASHIWGTRTSCHVIYNSTNRILTADSRTGVDAFISDASLVSRAI